MFKGGMKNMNKEYKLNIDPRILELLGPSLYTNIYYILAELIANAYDADAHNVYIISNKDDITAITTNQDAYAEAISNSIIEELKKNEQLTIEEKINDCKQKMNKQMPCIVRVA